MQRGRDDVADLEKEIEIVEGSEVDLRPGTEKEETKVKLFHLLLQKHVCTKIIEYRRSRSRSPQRRRSSRYARNLTICNSFWPNLVLFRSPQRGRHGRSRYFNLCVLNLVWFSVAHLSIAHHEVIVISNVPIVNVQTEIVIQILKKMTTMVFISASFIYLKVYFKLYRNRLWRWWRTWIDEESYGVLSFWYYKGINGLPATITCKYCQAMLTLCYWIGGCHKRSVLLKGQYDTTDCVLTLFCSIETTQCSCFT